MTTSKKIKILITGSTGMVGEGVLHECLNSNEVEKVVSISRKSCGVIHPKFVEIIHENFYDIAPIINQLNNFDACFFCSGVSSVGCSSEEYYKNTYILTLNFAEILSKLNVNMSFIYVSGAGTDSTENGKITWARIKGKTENDLMKLSFKNVYAFRPGFMLPTKGLKNVKSFYKYINWLYPIGKLISPKGFSTLAEVGKAMINITLKGYQKNIIDGNDISKLA